MKLPKLKYVPVHDWLVNQCNNKTVLHLGCAGDALLSYGAEASVQYKLLKVAKKVWGVELNPDSLNQIKQWCPESPNDDSIRYFTGNVERLEELNINQTFDVIVAGAIIEHLSNPGLMLTGLKRFCNSNTIILISTPHVWGVLQFMRVLVYRNEAVNPEHTCWYSIPTITELTSRYGYIPVEFATGYSWKQPSLKWKIKKFLGTLFFTLFPHLGGSLLVSFRLK
jgi:ubiquinone/menaquinone biosynthesis C-methylase UbiE